MANIAQVDKANEKSLCNGGLYPLNNVPYAAIPFVMLFSTSHTISIYHTHNRRVENASFFEPECFCGSSLNVGQEIQTILF